MASDLGSLFTLCVAATATEGHKHDGTGTIHNNHKSHDGNACTKNKKHIEEREEFYTSEDALAHATATARVVPANCQSSYDVAAALPSAEEKFQSSFSNEQSVESDLKKQTWNNHTNNYDNNKRGKSKSTKRKRAQNDRSEFPVILMAILTQPRNEEMIAFLSDNRSFIIVNPQRLKREVLPLHFDESNSDHNSKTPKCKKTCKVDCTRHTPSLRRFRALLAMWGFETFRNPACPDVEVHGHSSFKRGDWEACIAMKPVRRDVGAVLAISEGSDRSSGNFNYNGTKRSNSSEWGDDGATVVPDAALYFAVGSATARHNRIPKVRSVTPTDGSNGGSGERGLLLSSASPEQRRQQECYQRNSPAKQKRGHIQLEKNVEPTLSSTIKPSLPVPVSLPGVRGTLLEKATQLRGLVADCFLREANVSLLSKSHFLGVLDEQERLAMLQQSGQQLQLHLNEQRQLRELQCMEQQQLRELQLQITMAQQQQILQGQKPRVEQRRRGIKQEEDPSSLLEYHRRIFRKNQFCLLLNQERH